MGVNRLTTQRTVDNDLLEGDHTALAFYKTASEQRAMSNTRDHEQLLVSRAAVDAPPRIFREDMKTGLI